MNETTQQVRDNLHDPITEMSTCAQALITLRSGVSRRVSPEGGNIKRKEEGLILGKVQGSHHATMSGNAPSILIVHSTPLSQGYITSSRNLSINVCADG